MQSQYLLPPSSTSILKHLNIINRSSHRGAVVNESARNHEVAGLIPGPTHWVKGLALL